MKFNFTKEMLREILNGNRESDEWFEALNETLPQYNIDTEKRVAGFLAQCAHESDDFKQLEENLNYSEAALTRVFSRYFGQGKESAAEYARKPEKIANYVYMDKNRTPRGALGNVVDGDGWRFRGRGLKQLTGRNNYAAFGASVDMTAEEAADYVATKKGAVESACWFWDARYLNGAADDCDIIRMTRIINGGLIGLEDRTQRYKKAMGILTGELSVPAFNYDQVVQLGDRNDTVKKIQEALGAPADGIFGPGTKRAVQIWQETRGLNPDGIVGPNTLKEMFG